VELKYSLRESKRTPCSLLRGGGIGGVKGGGWPVFEVASHSPPINTAGYFLLRIQIIWKIRRGGGEGIITEHGGKGEKFSEGMIASIKSD
jgi:hypothetical protein